MAPPGNTLIADADGRPYDYSRYVTMWDSVMRHINAAGHTTHDCRHTVTTLLDNAGANEVAKRRVLGHVSGDAVTERVYTHKNLRQLRKCIQLLK
jgi:integrase